MHIKVSMLCPLFSRHPDVPQAIPTLGQPLIQRTWKWVVEPLSRYMSGAYGETQKELIGGVEVTCLVLGC